MLRRSGGRVLQSSFQFADYFASFSLIIAQPASVAPRQNDYDPVTMVKFECPICMVSPFYLEFCTYRSFCSRVTCLGRGPSRRRISLRDLWAPILRTGRALLFLVISIFQLIFVLLVLERNVYIEYNE